VLFAALALIPAWGEASGNSGSASPKPDRELSRRFLPPKYRIADPEARERIRAYFQRQPRDSGEVLLRGNSVRLNAGGLRRLEQDSAVGGGAPESTREPSRQRARRKLEQLAGSGIEEDPVYSAQEYLPDDIGLQSTPQWGLHNDGSMFLSAAGIDIGMSKVWEKFDGDDSIVIAVLDAGINFYHPDLQGKWFVNQKEAKGLPGVDDDGNGFIDDSTGWDFVDGDNRPLDSHGHGTFLSGVIAAGYDNGLGVAGMLPRAKILPVRVLSTTGAGYSSDIAAGMRYAARMGADVINFSIGIGSTALDTVLRNGFYVARDSGVIVAAASANDARNLDAQPRAPANYKLPNVYMVASHTQGGQLSGFSNYGATSVDLAAPGDGIMTTAIPAAVEKARETFEGPTYPRLTFSGFAVSADTMQAAQSARLTGGNGSSIVWDSVDLRGRTGGALSFMLEFQRATNRDDWLVAEVCTAASCVLSSSWTTVAIVNENVTGKPTLNFNLGVVDGKLFRLRFRSDFIGSGTRTLRIDDVRVKYADEDPAHQNNYVATGGTSLAAPFVAGYAALMQVACARMGVPFTRERMLAGVAPDSFLVGKVITGGRLDVAKGLDFYLRTLPSLKVAEPDTLWYAGNPVRYNLSVRDTLGQALTGYTITAGPATAGGGLAGSQYNWNQGSQTGNFTARFRAEKPPLVLRTQVRFTLSSGPIALADAGRTSPILRIGNRDFYLPASALRRDAHSLRLEIIGADGRTRETLTGDLLIPPGTRRAEYRLSGFTGVGIRAWLDGVPLEAARR
jgi:subtilisin family serine protease